MWSKRIRGAILLAVMIPLGAGALGCGSPGGVDRANYSAVAEDFLLKNALIARKIGKVEELDHFGDGGGTGDVSYEVYRLTGAKSTATCTLTLHRDETGWKVTAAVMNTGGTDYRIPVRKAEPGGFLRMWRR